MCTAFFSTSIQRLIHYTDCVFTPILFVHRLGMHHDSDGNDCENGKNIMATWAASGPQSMKWSSCSAKALREFLRLDSVPLLMCTVKPATQCHLKSKPNMHSERDAGCFCRIVSLMVRNSSGRQHKVVY